jgi:ribonuclease P protein component
VVSKQHRFTGQNTLRYLFKKGNSVRGNLLTLRYLRNNRTTSYRVAVVVSKKVTKSAPKRNRIRRRIYEIIRLNNAQYLQNHDIAFIVFNDKIATMPHAELEQIIIGQLKQISKSDKK